MIVIFPDGSTQSLGGSACTIEALLTRFGINPLEVVVSVNDRIIPEDAVVGGDDRVRIIRIAHGG